MKHGDILLTRGKSYTSTLIARWSKEAGVAEFSHAALFLAGHPFPLIIEAVPPRVRVCSLADALNHAEYAVLMESLTLTDEQRDTVCKSALRFEGALYGAHRLIAFGLDAIFDTDVCSHVFGVGKALPVCSIMVAGTFATLTPPLEFGEPAHGVTPNEIGTFGYQRTDLYRLSKMK